MSFPSPSSGLFPLPEKQQRPFSKTQVPQEERLGLILGGWTERGGPKNHSGLSSQPFVGRKASQPRVLGSWSITCHNLHKQAQRGTRGILSLPLFYEEDSLFRLLKDCLGFALNFPFQVVDHYENPRNVGSLDKKAKNVGTGLVGAPACGDVMKLQVSKGPAFPRQLSMPSLSPPPFS